MLLSWSVILFVFAALLGVLNIIKVQQEKETNKAVVFGHGLFAAAALVLLLVHVFTVEMVGTLLTISSILFVIAALGGFILFSRDIQDKQPPKTLAWIHASAAVVAFVLLLVEYFG